MHSRCKQQSYLSLAAALLSLFFGLAPALAQDDPLDNEPNPMQFGNEGRQGPGGPGGFRPGRRGQQFGNGGFGADVPQNDNPQFRPGQNFGGEDLPPRFRQRRNFGNGGPGQAGGPGRFAGPGGPRGNFQGGAGQFPGRQAMGRGFGGPLDLRALNLTEEQKQRIKELRGRSSIKSREFRQTLRQKRMEMRNLMFDPNASAAQIKAKQREVRQLQERVDDLQVDDFLAIKDTLTMEQKQKLAQEKSTMFRASGEPTPVRQQVPPGNQQNAGR